MVLAIGVSAFIAFDLEKVEFVAIPKRTAVANVLENRSILSHPCGRESRDYRLSFEFHHNTAVTALKRKLTSSPP